MCSAMTKRPNRPVAFRLEERIATHVDALVDELTTPWWQATRSDALRVLLLRGLSVIAPEPEGER
jgi:hypothetical protein